jgi:hypothetical protein
VRHDRRRDRRIAAPVADKPKAPKPAKPAKPTAATTAATPTADPRAARIMESALIEAVRDFEARQARRAEVLYRDEEDAIFLLLAA